MCPLFIRQRLARYPLGRGGRGYDGHSEGGRVMRPFAVLLMSLVTSLLIGADALFAAQQPIQTQQQTKRYPLAPVFQRHRVTDLRVMPEPYHTPGRVPNVSQPMPDSGYQGMPYTGSPYAGPAYAPQYYGGYGYGGYGHRGYGYRGAPPRVNQPDPGQPTHPNEPTGSYYGGEYQRSYPYHLDYYKMRYGGSYKPYNSNLYVRPPVNFYP